MRSQWGPYDWPGCHVVSSHFVVIIIIIIIIIITIVINYQLPSLSPSSWQNGFLQVQATLHIGIFRRLRGMLWHQAPSARGPGRGRFAQRRSQGQRRAQQGTWSKGGEKIACTIQRSHLTVIILLNKKMIRKKLAMSSMIIPKSFRQSPTTAMMIFKIMKMVHKCAQHHDSLQRLWLPPPNNDPCA